MCQERIKEAVESKLERAKTIQPKNEGCYRSRNINCDVVSLKDIIIDQALAILRPLAEEPEAGEFTKRARFQLDEGTLPVTTDGLAEDSKYHIPRDIVEFYHDACDIIDRQAAELKNLKDTVQLNCNPPDDCNDPSILKAYMKTCFDQALRVQEYPQ